MIDVLGLGVSAVDDILYVDKFPEQDTKMQIARSERRLGGLTAVALAAVARLGGNAAYAGVLGNDEISSFVESELRRVGVDTSLVVYRDDARPVHAVIIADLSTSSRTILFELTGRTGADENAPSAETIRSSRALFVDDHGMPGSIRAAHIAREAGVPIVGDFERDHWPRFFELFALVNHVIVGQHFARRVTGTDDLAEAVLKLWTDTREVVAVTGGEKGCWYTANGVDIIHQPAFSVNAVDTTGCGDVFHGVYALELARGTPLDQRLRFASAAAALKSLKGGIDGIPTREQVNAFVP